MIPDAFFPGILALYVPSDTPSGVLPEIITLQIAFVQNTHKMFWGNMKVVGGLSAHLRVSSCRATH